MYKYIILTCIIFILCISIISCKSEKINKANKSVDKPLAAVIVKKTKDIKNRLNKLSEEQKKVLVKKEKYIKLINNDKSPYYNNRHINYNKLYNICTQHFKYKYVWGASKFEQNGFDCSGYIYHIFKLYNKPIPRTTAYKYYFLFNSKPFNWKYSNTGDIIWWSFTTERPYGHIGMILKNLINKSKAYLTQSGSSTGPTISLIYPNSYWDRHFSNCKIGL